MGVLTQAKGRGRGQKVGDGEGSWYQREALWSFRRVYNAAGAGRGSVHKKRLAELLFSRNSVLERYTVRTFCSEW